MVFFAHPVSSGVSAPGSRESRYPILWSEVVQGIVSGMSSTLLHWALGLRDYGCGKTVCKDFKVYFHIEDRRPRCSGCGWEEVVRDGAYERSVRLPPIDPQLVLVVLPVPW